MGLGRRAAFVLDVGSASVRIVIGERKDDGSHKIVFNGGKVSNLRKALDESGCLDPAKAQKTLDAVASLLQQAGSCRPSRGACLCTQAVRQSSNIEWFLDRLQKIAGVEPEILSPKREGFLACLGSQDLMGDGGLLIDFGGGSTELIERSPEGPVRIQSYPLGAGVPIPGLDDYDCGKNSEWDSIRDTADRMWDCHLDAGIAHPGGQAVVLGGTVTTLGAIREGMQPFSPGKLHGARLGVSDLESVTRLLYTMSLDARRNIRGMEPGRESIIVNGGILLSGLLAKLHISQVVISERGIRFGRLEELLQTDF